VRLRNLCFSLSRTWRNCKTGTARSQANSRHAATQVKVNLTIPWRRLRAAYVSFANSCAAALRIALSIFFLTPNSWSVPVQESNKFSCFTLDHSLWILSENCCDTPNTCFNWFYDLPKVRKVDENLNISQLFYLHLILDVTLAWT
jgi:hypothetical protein